MSVEKKVVVVGAGGVGKSALTIQFIQGTFTAQYDPTIEDSYRKQIEVDHNHIILDILDTAGQEEYSSMRAAYMRTGNGFVVVYSITSQESFKELDSIYKTMLRAKNAETVPMVLLGNKVDLECDRVISSEQGEELSTRFKCPFFETSAKTNVNVTEAYHQVAREILAVQPAISENSEKQKGGSSKSKKGTCTVL